MKLLVTALIYVLLGIAQVQSAKYTGGTPGSEGKTSEVMLGNKETPSQLCDYLKGKLNKPVTCKLHGTNMVTVDAPVADVKKYVSDIGAGTALSSATAPTVKPSKPDAATAGLPPPSAPTEASTAPTPVATSTPTPASEAASPPPVAPQPAGSPPAKEEEVQTPTQANVSSKGSTLELVILISLTAFLAFLIVWNSIKRRSERKTATAQRTQLEETIQKRDEQLNGLRDELTRANGQVGETHRQFEEATASLAAANKSNADWALRAEVLERENGNLQRELKDLQKKQPGSIFPVPVPGEMMEDGESANLEMEAISVTCDIKNDTRMVTYAAKSSTEGEQRLVVLTDEEITAEYILSLLMSEAKFRRVAANSLGRPLKPLPIDSEKTGK